MIQKLFILLCLTLFLTACSSSSSTDSDVTDLPDGASLTKLSADAKAANEAQTYSFGAIGVQNTNNGFTDVSVPLELTFDGEGKMSVANFALGGDEYAANLAIGYSENSSESSNVRIYGSLDIAGTNQGEYSSFWVSRGFNDGLDSADDFISEYMVSVIWNNQSTTNNDDKGYLVAGFETAGSDIPSTNNTIFTGNGEGRYYNGSYLTNLDFDAQANVNFSNRTVAFSTSNTHYYMNVDGSDELVLRKDLDINATLAYITGVNAISNVEAVTLTADGKDITAVLKDINARFYGTDANAAQEFGGTFNFSNPNNSNYYYGFFGARRATTSIPSEPQPNEPTTFNSNNLNSFNDDARKGTSNNNFQTVNIVALSRSEQLVETRDVTDAATVEFDYDSEGAFSVDGLKFSRGDKTYSATNAEIEGNILSGNMLDSSGATINADFTLSNDSVFFGFTPTYMAFVFLEIIDDIKSSTFAMTGFETDGASIPITGNARFSGKGSGAYRTIHSGGGSGGGADFTLTADVNFSSRDVALTARQDLSSRADLNFTGDLSYDASENALTGAITSTGGEDFAQLTGTANARFYGTGSDDARELGGTFSMSNNSNIGYIGFFGAQRYIAPPPPTRPTLTNAGYDSLAEASTGAANASANETLVLKGVGAQTKIIYGSGMTVQFYQTVASLTFDDAGNIVATDVYIDDGKYTHEDLTNDSNTRLWGVIGDNSYQTLTLNREFSDSFTSQYMIAGDWNYSPDHGLYNGYIIAGMETAGNDIPTDSGTVSFEGNGKGYYGNAVGYTTTTFGVTADVNFSAFTVALTLKNTLDEYDTPFDFEDRDLNFTANLTYDSKQNNISGDVVTLGKHGTPDSAVQNDAMFGTVNARFYGTGDNAAQELGGTFSMENVDFERSYIGYFGSAQCTQSCDSSVFPTIATTNAPDIAYGGYYSINAVADAVQAEEEKNYDYETDETAPRDPNFIDTLILSGVALQDERSVNYKRSNTSTQWDGNNHFVSGNGAISRITKPVISLKFEPINEQGDIYGILSTVTLYIDDESYEATPTYYDIHVYFNGEVNALPDDNRDVRLSPSFYSDKDEFDFEARYMVSIAWGFGESLSETATTDTLFDKNGYMVAGLETNNIPNAGNVTFKGSGEGYYSTTAGIYEPRFNVTADVDFSARTVSLATTDTTYYNSNADLFTPLDNLNFTSTLKYDAGKNNISGAVSADGMNGTIDARFFGTSVNAVRELGGTFGLKKDDSEYYYGYFGAYNTSPGG